MWTWLLENPAKIAEWARTGHWEDVVIDNAQRAIPLVYNAREIRAYNYAELAWMAIELSVQYGLIPWILESGGEYIYHQAFPPAPEPVIAPAPAPADTSWFGSIKNAGKWAGSQTFNIVKSLPIIGSIVESVAKPRQVFKNAFLLALSKWINENWFREAWDRNAPLGITFMRPFFEMCDEYIERVFGRRDVNIQLRDFVPNFEGTILSPIQSLAYKIRNLAIGQDMGNGLTRVDHERWYKYGEDYLIPFSQWAGNLYIQFKRGSADMLSYVKTPIQGMSNVLQWVVDLILPVLKYLRLDEAFDNTVDAVGDWATYLKDGVLAIPGTIFNGLWNFNSNWSGLPLIGALGTMGLIYYNRQFIWSEIKQRLGRNTKKVEKKVDATLNITGLPQPQPLAAPQPLVVNNNMSGQQQHVVGQPAQVYAPHFAGGVPGQNLGGAPVLNGIGAAYVPR